MKYLHFRLRQAQDILTDARYIPFFLQRRFRSNTWRVRLTKVAIAGKPIAAPPTLQQQSLLNALRHEGIAPFDNLLSSQQLAQMREYFLNIDVYDSYAPQDRSFNPHGNRRPPHAHGGYCDTADVLNAPHLLALANRPEILAVAVAYLDCNPTIDYLEPWWSFAADGVPQAAENFRCDVDDWRFLKLFVYLTDVGPDNDPHVYIVGAAQDEHLRKIRRHSDEEVRGAFGEAAIISKASAAGNGFLENTFGLHKGQPVEVGKRLRFQAVYSINALPYAPKRPKADLAEVSMRCTVPLDPYVNRLYLRDNSRP